jgi:hypothetical protein
MSSKTIIGLTTVVVLAAAVVALSPATGEAAQGRGNKATVTEARVEGVIVAVTPMSVTIRTQAGVNVTVLVTAATKVERNGVRVPLSALRLGDYGQARFNPATLVASKVEAVGP